MLPHFFQIHEDIVSLVHLLNADHFLQIFICPDYKKKKAYISCYLKEKVILVSLLALHSPPVATCNSHDADIKQSNSK